MLAEEQSLLVPLLAVDVGVTVTADEAEPVPAEFVAVTLQEYETSFVRPLTVIGLEVADSDCESDEAVQVAV